VEIGGAARQSLIDKEPELAASQLIMAAAGPWSPATHELFPHEARARAVALLRVGYLLAYRRLAGAADALTTAWVDHVLPAAITRETGRPRADVSDDRT